MQEYMQSSDVLGEKAWAKRGGWILDGGAQEFQRRVRPHYGDGGGAEKRRPRYAGLAVGRLWGHTRKLPDEASGDLSFSMKCVAGALVLTLGLDAAWGVLRPLFLELLILSPEELRTSYVGVSDLVAKYKKGNK